MKKFLLFAAAFIGSWVYVSDHYTLKDLVTYAKKYPDPNLSPKVEYYTGMALYLRSDYPESARAFEQLLADYTTSYYAPRAMYRLGAVYTEQRQWQSARDMYQRYMDEYPNGEQVEAVKKKYEYIKFR